MHSSRSNTHFRLGHTTYLEVFSASQEHSNLIMAIRLEVIYRMFIDCSRQEVRLDDQSKKFKTNQKPEIVHLFWRQ